VRAARSCALALAIIAGCSRPRVAEVTTPPIAPPPVVAAVNPWPATLLAARRAVDHGDYDEADRILSEFASAHPNTAEGAESDFYRALFKSDPANVSVSLREQLAALDTYLGGGTSLPRYSDAMILRRLVEAVDSSRAQVVAVRAAHDARERAKDAQIQKLSDDLERTVAELERIKRRLAKP
jgi:hypothetical protein